MNNACSVRVKPCCAEVMSGRFACKCPFSATSLVSVSVFEVVAIEFVYCTQIAQHSELNSSV